MMKLYSAISPSMNDQWSGKILLQRYFTPLAGADALVEEVHAAGPPAAQSCSSTSQKLGPTASCEAVLR